MSISTVLMPRIIHYGVDAFCKVGEEAALLGKKALIISDSIIQKLGHVETCERTLGEAHVDHVTYLGIKSEPTDVYVYEALDLLKQ